MVISACTPKKQQFLPVSQEAYMNDSFFVMVDGAKLPYRKWFPNSEPKAVVLAVHGFNDYSHSFKSTGEYLSQQGIAVYAYDQRGFGETDNIGIWANEKNMVRDLVSNINSLKRKHPDIPLYVMGESMGGAVVISTLAGGYKTGIKGAILSAPAVWGDKGMSPFLRATSWLTAHTIPSMKFSGESFEVRASDNVEILKELMNDPLFIKKTRVDSTYGLVKLMGKAYKNGGKINTPLLVLYGDDDQLIPKKATRDFINSLKTDYTFVYYPNSYHMLTRGLSQATVLKDISEWILKREIPSGFEKRNIPEKAK